MNKPVFALIDCNNFFVSCERIFRPDLESKPVVVLSSNDGCAIARSNEAKALGIPMAAPAFKYRDIFEKHGVTKFSANFELYGEISERIVNLLCTLSPRVEVYSIDESFLDLSELQTTNYVAWARQVQAQILQEIGVPVSIGIAPSKTLAKLAAERAKKDALLDGVLDLVNLPEFVQQAVLASTPVDEVWGVGWRLAPKLRAEGVTTAFDLAKLRPQRAGQLMGVHGKQMVSELNGTSCIPLEPRHDAQKSIMRGRTFGEDTSDFTVLEAAISSLTARATNRLRKDRQLTHKAAIVLYTNKHKPGYQRFVREVRFVSPTADTGLMCQALLEALRSMYSPALSYHRANVFLYDLTLNTSLQIDLLGEINLFEHVTSQSRMKAVDSINARFGKHHIYYAAEDLAHSWEPKHQLRSPRYVSNWSELPVVHLMNVAP